MAESIKSYDKSAANAIRQLINIRERYIAGVTAAYSEYREEYNQGKDLFTAEALLQRRTKARNAGKRNVSLLYQTMIQDAAKAFETMREALAMWATETPNKDVMEQLRAYKDFGVKIGEAEINALLERAAGNYITMCCIDSVARKSGYRVTLTPFDEFKKDVDELESGFNNMQYFVPDGFDDYLTHLLPDRTMVNGVPQGYVTSINVAISNGLTRKLSEKLKKVLGRWDLAVLPEVSKALEDEEKKEEQKEQETEQRVTDPNTKADTNGPEQLAQESAETRMKQAKRSKEILEMYGAKFKQEEPHDAPQDSAE